jgi:hypothetical protein
LRRFLYIYEYVLRMSQILLRKTCATANPEEFLGYKP